MFDKFPDAFYVRVSDRIVVEFLQDSEISLDQLAAISDGLNTDNLCVRASEDFRIVDGVPSKVTGMTLEVLDWTFMEGEDE